MDKSKMSNELIVHRINELSDQIKEGFEGVHHRQDLTNGKVQKNTEWRIYITGALGVISAIIIPIMLYLVYIHIS